MEHFPSSLEALGLIPSTKNSEEEEEKMKRMMMMMKKTTTGRQTERTD